MAPELKSNLGFEIVPSPWPHLPLCGVVQVSQESVDCVTGRAGGSLLFHTMAESGREERRRGEGITHHLGTNSHGRGGFKWGKEDVA